jgi:RNA polymerase sigma-54 factor
MLRQSLEQKLQQKLSPAQIQVIKMLEVPTLELEERIRQELEENPALEEGQEQSENDFDEDMNDDGGNNDDMDLEEYMVDDDIPDYRLKVNNTSKDDKREDIPFSIGTTFHENLIAQLGLQQLSEHERLLAEYVIGNIDDEGYLRRTVESMVDDIVFHAGVHTTDEEMTNIVSLIQEFDPPGVAATSLQECLILQLERKIYNPRLDTALKIVEE